MHPFLQGLKPTLHISHRGGAGLAPENTLAAFTRAVREFKTQMIELDVQLSADGELVVAHDETLERCTNGAGPLSALTLAELRRLDAGYKFTMDEGQTFPFRGTGIVLPTLQEVLRAFPQLPLNVEVKVDVPGVEHVLAQVLRAEHAVERVCCGSEMDAVAARIAKVIPESCQFFPREALTQYVLGIRSGDGPSSEERYQVLDMPLYWQGVRLIDAEFLQAARADGRWVNVWTVDEPAEMRVLLQEGVGGIMTDRPDLLRQVMDS
jgi:glycerophosphoryl diester phosphodiesterase